MQSTYLMFKRPSTSAAHDRLSIDKSSRRHSFAHGHGENRNKQNNVDELSADRLNHLLDGKGEQHGILEQIVDGVNESNRPKNSFPKVASEVITPKEKWKQRLRIVLPHVGLVILSTLYTLLGAAIFHHLEMPFEIHNRNLTAQRVFNLKESIVTELWQMIQNSQNNISSLNYNNFSLNAHHGMNRVIQDVFVDYTKNYMIPQDIINGTGPLKWTFRASVFFSWTSITTIGYGHIFPKTGYGKIAILAYALFGIPLILVTIADMGRFLSGGIIWLYNFLRKIVIKTVRKVHHCVRMFFCCECCKNLFTRTRSKNTDVPKSLEEDVESVDKMNNNDLRRLSDLKMTIRKKPPGILSNNIYKIPTIMEDDTLSETGTLGDVSEIHTVDDSNGPVIDEPKGKKHASIDEPSSEEEFEPIEHERRVSVLFILFIMLTYTAGGAYLMQLWENWDFMEAFYFCFVSVTTIGFGDVIPQNNDCLYLTLAYIIFGLIITTMCIDLVGSEYIRDIHFYGRSLGRSFLTFGGKVVHLSEVFSYVAFLQKNYGLTPEQLDRLAQLPEEYLLDCLVNGKQPDLNWVGGRPFIPQDIYYFKWIEQPRTLSFVSERVLASMESLDLNTSRCSTARTLTPKEYYQKILVHYCRQMQPPPDSGIGMTAIDS